MYSLRSKWLLNAPQASSESGACGSSIAISSRDFGCRIGTNSAPAPTARRSGAHSPVTASVCLPSTDPAENFWDCARKARTSSSAAAASARNCTPCVRSFAPTIAACSGGTR